jgi:hypothetical protein
MTTLKSRHVYCLILIGIFIGCTNNTKQKTKEEPQYSSTQKYLFQLLNNYKAEYFAAKSIKEKGNIQAKYQDKMKHFLVDSLERYIDSMAVIVDTVIQEGWLVTTQFHANDIEFKYGMKFQDSMPPSADSLYRFMLSLSTRQQVTVNFIHLGGGELNFPEDKSKRTMRIFAYPEPLKADK